MSNSQMLRDKHAIVFGPLAGLVRPSLRSLRRKVRESFWPATPMEGEDSKFVAAVSGGWPQILSNLKSLLETGATVLQPRS